MAVGSLKIRLVPMTPFAQAGIHIPLSEERGEPGTVRVVPGSDAVGRVARAAINFALVAQRKLRGDADVARRFNKYFVTGGLPNDRPRILDIAVVTAVANVFGADDTLGVFHENIAGLPFDQRFPVGSEIVDPHDMTDCAVSF